MSVLLPRSNDDDDDGRAVAAAAAAWLARAEPRREGWRLLFLVERWSARVTRRREDVERGGRPREGRKRRGRNMMLLMLLTRAGRYFSCLCRYDREG